MASMKYGMTVENINLINVKASSKKNGVYTFRGLIYKVKGNKVTHLAYNGMLIECCGHFNVEIGNYSGYESDAKKALKELNDKT